MGARRAKARTEATGVDLIPDPDDGETVAAAPVHAVRMAEECANCLQVRWVAYQVRRLGRMVGDGIGVILPNRVTGKRPPASLTR